MTIRPARIGVDRVLDARERIGRACAAILLAISIGFLVIRLLCVSASTSRQLRGARDVLADHVAFEVDAVADGAALRRFVCVQRERHDLHVEPVDRPGRRPSG